MEHMLQPFGEVSCEREVEILQTQYQKYFFDHVPFTEQAIDQQTYLIIGRRGSGKTSLSRYFAFQRRLRNSSCLDVDEPELYNEVLSKLSARTSTTKELAIPKIVQMWEYVIWALVFDHFRDRDQRISAACLTDREQKSSPARIVLAVLKRLLNKLLSDDKGELADEVETWLMSDINTSAKKAVLDHTRSEPLIIALDSLEHYNVNDEAMMRATAALVQCASHFNLTMAQHGIHLKVFLSAEVFPALAETVITNPIKYVRRPIHLHWRPKDLIRLVCWRYFQHLRSHKLLGSNAVEPNWDDFGEVLAKIWIPHFGLELCNQYGCAERTFPYVLRHTQMRPRQLIHLCNEIATRAAVDSAFTPFPPAAIVGAIRDSIPELSTEVINAYSSIYPHVPRIVEALVGLPMVFKGSALDRVAPRTASEWQKGEYSPLKFRHVVGQLGIVGRVRKQTANGIVEADFEYAMDDRISLQADDLCAIHPMFCEKLKTDTSHPVTILPFPDRPAFEVVRQS